MRRHIKKALSSTVVTLKLHEFRSLTEIKFSGVFMVLKFLVILCHNKKGIHTLALMIRSLNFRMLPHMVEKLLE